MIPRSRFIAFFLNIILASKEKSYMPNLPKLLKFYLILVLTTPLLVGCAESSPTSALPTGYSPSVVSSSPSPSFTALPPTAPPTLSQSEAATRDKVQTALTKVASTTRNYTFKVNQSAEIKNGGATTTIEAKGSGSYATPNFYQKLDLTSGDQSQSLEYYLTGTSGYQRLNALAVWRKLGPEFSVSTTLTSTLPLGAVGFQVSSIGQGQTQLRYIFPTAQLFSQKEVNGPEILGILSATGIYQPFIASPDRSAQTEVKLVINDANGVIVRREISFTVNGPQNSLAYRAIYDYSDLNTANSNITPPPDLPK